jgi:5-deoxy-glucuronate isomerase
MAPAPESMSRLRSRRLAAHESGVLVEITRRAAGWQYLEFAVRQLAAGHAWSAETGSDELCLVLLEGTCEVTWAGGGARLGPRRDVFSSYPHAVYLPPGASFTVTSIERTEVAEGRAPASEHHAARVIRPEDCGFEIRGGGNATRQIVDILPPSFPAQRLLVCEVYTPSGNWSSYPPHKHDADDPPAEVALEETYYYRFRARDAYGIQRLYEADDRNDQAIVVSHGDLVPIRRGYHPFVSAHGYDAYYLNVLAGTRRSMAARDDPRYAALRSSWPAPDPRVPTVPPPYVPAHR